MEPPSSPPPRRPLSYEKEQSPPAKEIVRTTADCTYWTYVKLAFQAVCIELKRAEIARVNLAVLPHPDGLLAINVVDMIGGEMIQLSNVIIYIVEFIATEMHLDDDGETYLTQNIIPRLIHDSFNIVRERLEKGSDPVTQRITWNHRRDIREDPSNWINRPIPCRRILALARQREFTYWTKIEENLKKSEFHALNVKDPVLWGAVLVHATFVEEESTRKIITQPEGDMSLCSFVNYVYEAIYLQLLNRQRVKILSNNYRKDIAKEEGLEYMGGTRDRPDPVIQRIAKEWINLTVNQVETRMLYQFASEVSPDEKADLVEIFEKLDRQYKIADRKPALVPTFLTDEAERIRFQEWEDQQVELDQQQQQQQKD